MQQSTRFKEVSCKNCLLSVFIGGHFLCTKYGISVEPYEACGYLERRFKNEVPDKTVIHTSEVVIKKL